MHASFRQAVGALAVLITMACACANETAPKVEEPSYPGTSVARLPLVPLPPADTERGMALNKALASRRSIRTYTGQGLDKASIGQLLWSAQGRTSETGGRTAPSAGGRYPLEVYIVTGRQNQDLEPGAYRYIPDQHALEPIIADADLRERLSRAALDQPWVREAPMTVVISAVSARTKAVYGERGLRYVILEVGHAAQNVLLEAVALGLGAVPVGAFDDDQVRRILLLSAEETPLYLIPVGYPRPE